MHFMCGAYLATRTTVLDENVRQKGNKISKRKKLEEGKKN